MKVEIKIYNFDSIYIDLDEKDTFEYKLFLDVSILKIKKSLSFVGVTIKDIFKILNDNKENIYCVIIQDDRDKIIVQENYSSASKLNISYSVVEYNKEVLELLYLNK